jgi:hypothetical protein
MPTKQQSDTTTALRHGDLVIHAVGKQPVKGLKTRPGNVLAAGDSTSLKHTFRPATAGKMYEAGNGDVLLRLAKRATLTHDGADGHQDIALAPGDYRVSRKRQYDAEHGWRAVRD